ncbi:hypothetical protein J6590_033698 [Homalodisca vitripennis]|nr:hypothetical protein J6590_033698 [Homalodisca vitripennis]
MAITNSRVFEYTRQSSQWPCMCYIRDTCTIDSRNNVAMAITNSGVSDSQRGGPVGGIYAALVPSIPARWPCRWYIRGTATIDSRSNIATAITSSGVSDSQRGGSVGGIFAAQSDPMRRIGRALHYTGHIALCMILDLCREHTFAVRQLELTTLTVLQIFSPAQLGKLDDYGSIKILVDTIGQLLTFVPLASPDYIHFPLLSSHRRCHVLLADLRRRLLLNTLRTKTVPIIKRFPSHESDETRTTLYSCGLRCCVVSAPCDDCPADDKSPRRARAINIR